MGKQRKHFWIHSIQTRISGAVLVVLVAVLALNLFLISEINSAVGRIDSVYKGNVSVNTLSDTLESIQNAVYEYLNTKSSSALDAYYGYEQEYRSLLEELNDKNVDSEILMLEKNIRNMSETYLDQTSTTVQAKRGRNVERYKESYATQTQLYEYINTYIYRLNNLLFHQNSTSYQVLLSSMNLLERGSLILMAVAFFICMLAITLFVRGMIRPLSELSNAAYEVAQGNLDVPQLPVIYEDEVGIVTHSFNRMLASVREYIDRLKESLEKEAQLKERELLMEANLNEAQLKYLQAQINPHFLFNSLNAGAQLAYIEDAEQTGEFLERMADHFRYNVRKMSEDATLLEELESVDNYIYILNVRFAGDITYEKEISGHLSDLRVPSMILQPIVENAVQHGIRDLLGEEGGTIRLSVTQSEKTLDIAVSDNGRGMTAGQIQAILRGEHVNRKKTSTGVAMRNVLQRLELYYNRKELLQIESDGPGMGTTVRITLPLAQGEAHV